MQRLENECILRKSCFLFPIFVCETLEWISKFLIDDSAVEIDPTLLEAAI